MIVFQLRPFLLLFCFFFFFQAEDGIRDRSPSRGLGDVYKRQALGWLWGAYAVPINRPWGGLGVALCSPPSGFSFQLSAFQLLPKGGFVQPSFCFQHFSFSPVVPWSVVLWSRIPIVPFLLFPLLAFDWMLDVGCFGPWSVVSGPRSANFRSATSSKDMARLQRRRGSWTRPWPSSSATASAASPGAMYCTAFSLQADYRSKATPS